MSQLNHLNAIPPTLLTYVAAPYTVKREDGSEDKVAVDARVQRFSKCMEKLIERQITAVSPVLMHLVRERCANMPGDWNYWGNYSEIMLKKCDVLIVLQLEGWEESTGVAEEIKIANARKIPVIHIDPAELLTTPFTPNRRRPQAAMIADAKRPE